MFGVVFTCLVDEISLFYPDHFQDFSSVGAWKFRLKGWRWIQFEMLQYVGLSISQLLYHDIKLHELWCKCVSSLTHKDTHTHTCMCVGVISIRALMYPHASSVLLHGSVSSPFRPRHLKLPFRAQSLKCHQDGRRASRDPPDEISQLVLLRYSQAPAPVNTHTNECSIRHTSPTQTDAGLIEYKHVKTDGFRQWSLVESRSNREIVIKSKLWARLESLPSPMMRTCCLWNLSLHKHIDMQMRTIFNKNFTACSVFLFVVLCTRRPPERQHSDRILTKKELHGASPHCLNSSHMQLSLGPFFILLMWNSKQNKICYMNLESFNPRIRARDLF